MVRIRTKRCLRFVLLDIFYAFSQLEIWSAVYVRLLRLHFRLASSMYQSIGVQVSMSWQWNICFSPINRYTQLMPQKRFCLVLNKDQFCSLIGDCYRLALKLLGNCSRKKCVTEGCLQRLKRRGTELKSRALNQLWSFITQTGTVLN